jgi:hypothetical protein
MNASAGRCDTWLRGNVRPGLGLVLLAAAAAGIGLAVAGALGAPRRLLIAVGGAGATAVVAAGTLAWAAARPRLMVRGSAVRVRLAPLATHDVPLEFVECVFLGSRPLAGDTDAAEPDPAGRVATLVMRIAERATAWQSRPTIAAWGSWQDGHVVFDGRWCEPLTVDLARDVARRLLEAKRGCSAAGGGAECSR